MEKEGSLALWCIFSCLLAQFSNVAGSFKVTSSTVDGSMPIREYTSFSDASFNVRNVPPFARQIVWSFQTRKSDSRCEDRLIYIQARHGSFPLLRPNNESFPENFHVHETHSWSATLSTENVSYSHVVEDPLPGNWYVAYFINDFVDDKITQKGLGGLDCNYFMNVDTWVRWLEHVEVIDQAEEKFISMDNKFSQIYRVLLSELTWQLQVSVYGCIVSSDDNSTVEGCPLMVAARGEGLPKLDDSISDNTFKNCSGLDPCVLTVNSISTNRWNYIRFKALNEGNISFSFKLEAKECDRREFIITTYVNEKLTTSAASRNGSLNNQTNETQNATLDAKNSPFLTTVSPVSYTSNLSNATNDTLSVLTAANSTTSTSASSNVCAWLPELGRISASGQVFRSTFRLFFDMAALLMALHIPEDMDIILKATLEPGVDTGGTLRVALYFAGPAASPDIVETVEACIQRGHIPTSEKGCHGKKIVLSSEQSQDPVVQFPYPEPGAWYMSLRSKCYSNNKTDADGNRQVTNCSSSIETAFSFSIDRCVNDQCGKYGRCYTSYNADVYFSSCRCYAKWRGYGCTDGTVGETDGEQILAVLLLTLSNLAFIPSIVVSLYRRFFLEALVYFFTMFFSTFYHACDGDGAFLYCMIPYNTLAVCDFYGAIMSFWVTLIAMSRLTEPIRSFLYMLAALGLAVGVTWDRHSLWTFLVPAAVAFIIMAITWGIQMKQTRSCYPTKKRWLFRLLPGILIALIGLFVYAFLETQSNYQFTHSSWHACMAFAVVLILPPKRLNRVRDHKDSFSEYRLDSSFASSQNTYNLANPGFDMESETMPPKF